MHFHIFFYSPVRLNFQLLWNIDTKYFEMMLDEQNRIDHFPLTWFIDFLAFG